MLCLPVTSSYEGAPPQKPTLLRSMALLYLYLLSQDDIATFLAEYALFET